MKITIYDGANTIGGNKIYIKEGYNGIFLDFGMNFANYSKYYEEYLSERSARGIYDLWHLNLIPKLNIYRSDLIPKDLGIYRYPKIPINAVLISHAHLDHVGNVAILNEEIPMVGSSITMTILKALRDTSTGKHLGIDLPYYSIKKPKDEKGYVLESDRKSPYCSRKIILTDDNKNIEEFIFYRPGQNSSNKVKKINQNEVKMLYEEDFGFEIKAFEVDHSIYGAVGYIVEGDVSVAYTGDFREHGKNKDKTKKFIKEAKNASVLITEGTRVNRDNDVNVSEEDVYNNSLKIIENAKGLVIADFSPRNFERLEIFKEIAKKTGRELVITTKDAYFLWALKEVDKIDIIDDDVKIYENLKATQYKWEEEILDIYCNYIISPFEIRKNCENYILCFSFYDMPHLLDVNPDGGIYIYSSSEAFGEEQEFSFLRLWNWLKHFNFEIYGFKVDENGKPIFEKGFHTSGHISKEGLRRVIEKIDPDYIIPVHTENPELFRWAFGERVVLLNNGESLEI
ncbi:beta-lactamase domain-containing protein [Methanocaldococcus villosus KIN24-T80]|uniref:Beta-lactamase domain-containing protein n=1 Tax=Methanocaldococcus villosus KIN24-T80 TaxID=1069083 RepID=N6VS20_9EURY|nr:ribonuclease J [Methanocaldococcus villosus]ENN96675.1 beta-lactamase domain-containing protein [Methanocaldococcus villosus KIN24-T80]